MDHEWRVRIDSGEVQDIVLTGAQINYGVRNLGEAPSPNHATLTLLTPDVSADIARRFPDFGPGDRAASSGYIDQYADGYVGVTSRLVIGAPVEVDAVTASGYEDTYDDAYTGNDLRRFTGRIVAMDYTYGTVRLTCVDPLEALTRILVPTARPAETDRQRVAALATAAGVTIQFDGKGAVDLVANTQTGTQTLFAAIVSCAADAGALFYADRSGVIRYRTKDAIDPATFRLPGSATILDTLSMSADLGDVVNVLTVTYGEGNPRPIVTATDNESVTAYGRFAKNVTTNLATKAAAQDYADRQLAIKAFPAWAMPSAKVTMIGGDAEAAAAIANLDIDTKAIVGPLPVGAPSQEYTADVVGYAEELATPDWLVTYYLAPSTYEDGLRI